MLDGVHELWTAFHELSGDGQREWLLKVLQELKDRNDQIEFYRSARYMTIEQGTQAST